MQGEDYHIQGVPSNCRQRLFGPLKTATGMLCGLLESLLTPPPALALIPAANSRARWKSRSPGYFSLRPPASQSGPLYRSPGIKTWQLRRRPSSRGWPVVVFSKICETLLGGRFTLAAEYLCWESGRSSGTQYTIFCMQCFSKSFIVCSRNLRCRAICLLLFGQV